MTPANSAAAVGPMPSSVARRKSSTFSLLYMRTSSPDRPAVQLSVRTPKRIYGEDLIKNQYRHREVIMEEQTFRQAVEDHRDVVFRIALTYLRDRADADDVAQDVFLKLLKSDGHFESWEHLRRWLIRVTINECKSLFRKPWRRVEDIENLADSLSATQDETKVVLSDVMRLPERFRVPIVLYYYLGFSTSEIAELLHVPAATVRTRLARGRSKLKFILEEGDREIQSN